MSLPSPKLWERRITAVCLAAAMAVTVFLSWQRLRCESRSQPIEIALPEKKLMEFAAQDPTALDRLQRSGVTTMVREPYTLDDMIRYGLASAWLPEPDRMEVRFSDERLSGNAAVYLTGQLGLPCLKIQLREQQYVFDVKLPGKLASFDPQRFIMEIPYGPMPAGFRRALRLPAGDWGQASDLDQFIQALYALKPDIVIPDWKGGVNASSFFHAYLNTTWLRQPLLAVPEFNLPSGGARSLRLAKNRVLVRAHMLSSPGLGLLSPQRLQQQLVRAARERGVRLLYLNTLQSWSLAQTQKAVADLKHALHQAGLTTGPIVREPTLGTSLLAQIFILMGIGAAFFIFSWRLALWSTGATGQDSEIDRALTIHLRPVQFRWAAAALTLSLLILTAEGPAGWGVKTGAALLAVLAPGLGCMALLLSPRPARGWALLLASLREFAVVTGWSLAGGLGIAVLLYRPEFVQRLDSFSGVKAACLLPVAGALFYLFPQILDKEWWQQRLRPGLRWWTISGLVLMTTVLGFTLWRSGNTESLFISWTKRVSWDWLEANVSVLPRFNEFALGHPLLLLGLAGLRLPRFENAVWPKACLVFGVIGQVSLLNTFCHLHTPLAISLLRAGHGLWLGALIGGIGVWIMDRLAGSK